MDKLRRSVDVIANCLIALVAIALLVVLVREHLLVPPPKDDIGTIKPGAPVSFLQGGHLKKRTLILALSNSCHFCSESAPFYQRLAKQVDPLSGAEIVAILPQPVDAGRAYLEGLGVPIKNIKTVPLSSIPVRGTPTLILVNDRGIATNVWVGKLQPSSEAEVLSKLSCNSNCN